MRSMMLGLLFAMCLSGLTVSTASAGQASGLELNAQAVKDIATAIGAAQVELKGMNRDQRRAGMTKTLKVGGKDVTITLDRNGRAKLSTGGVDLGVFRPSVARDGSIRLSVRTLDPRGRLRSVDLTVSGNTMSARASRVYNALGLRIRGLTASAKMIISSVVLNVVAQTRANKTRQITVATLSGAVSP
jgi:hypothetical protein